MRDFLVVGAGLFGATFANLATRAGYKCTVIDERNHIGGNCYTKNINDIQIHQYGAHIFHTSDEKVWNFVNSHVKFNNYQHKVKANHNGRVYSLPFGMQLFQDVWGVTTPKDAQQKLQSVCVKNDSPRNFEEAALSSIGKELYERFVYGYTKKQWFREPSTLPVSIFKRLPIRFTWNDNYYNDIFQGIPINGYTELFECLLSDCDVLLNTNYNDTKTRIAFKDRHKHTVYTGKIDDYFYNVYGHLEYKTLDFVHKCVAESADHQGTSVMNYVDENVKYTRIIEHKHFTFQKSANTIITEEYPIPWYPTATPYYPMNDCFNNTLYEKYSVLAAKEKNVTFGGRLGNYHYYDMHQVIASAMHAFQQFGVVK